MHARNVLGGLLLALLFALPAGAHAAARAALIVDYDTGADLYAEEADARRYPASLTKVMTLYLVFDALRDGRLKTTQTLTASAHAAAQPETKLGLRAGDRISVRDAILGLTIRSANDAAVVLAEALGGSVSGFAGQMNARARKLGLKHTTFRNPHGLPDAAQVTTARDMVRLARALLRDFPEEYRYFSVQNFRFKGRQYRSHNRLLDNYPGADGIKTGYIRASGFNLVASARRDGRRIVGVVFGGSTAAERDAKMRSLLDKGFARLAAATPPRSASPKPVVAAAPAPAALPPLQLIATAATVTPAAAPEPAPGSTPPPSGNWQIQVGAFGVEGAARKRAREALALLPDSAAEREVVISTYRGGGATLYRSRIAGFSELAARDACEALQRRSIICLPVSSG